MNPYARILSLLEALPEDRRMLVSGQRRMVVAEAPCGCLFGSLVPERLWGSDILNRTSFSSQAFNESPLGEWLEGQLGAFPELLFDFVDELERENDRFMIGGNTPSECRARYDHMCNYLRAKATP